MMNCDIAILGGGMVGLSIANQLKKNNNKLNVIIVEKEIRIGLHSSGRNSGVLHAGLYYKPDSLKAKVCVSGAQRLRQWIEERELSINPCGKVIVPQSPNLSDQLDLLYKRGIKNGATVEIWDKNQLRDFIPDINSSIERGLWSPGTVVVNPKEVLVQLEKELSEHGVIFFKGETLYRVFPGEKNIRLSSGKSINYGHLINCTGLYADKVAKCFGVGENYFLFPFKGNYWEVKKDSPIQLNTNLYPVPDLNVPFLGVHFTPSSGNPSILSIGPTATPALGRENYTGFEKLEPLLTSRNIALLAYQYLQNRGGFRKYVHEQAFVSFKPLLIQSAQQLIPAIKSIHVTPSSKVGIRSQLYNKKSGKLEDDFLCLEGPDSTHVMNAISPAFTASFSLADLILEKTKLFK